MLWVVGCKVDDAHGCCVLNVCVDGMLLFWHLIVVALVAVVVGGGAAAAASQFCLQDGQSLNFRYLICPKQRVHTFEAKPLPQDIDLQEMRASQMGALYFKENKLNKLPSTSHCMLAWDVLCLVFVTYLGTLVMSTTLLPWFCLTKNFCLVQL